MTSALQIDHIVLLVSTSFFDSPPTWLTSNFTITPGGNHIGQSSRNKLIIFSDGTYLELFNWYDKPPPLDDESLPMRFWGPKKEGLIDYALTSKEEAANCVDKVNDKLSRGLEKDAGLGVKFDTPIPGSRKRADGVEIKWEVTRPVFTKGEKVPNTDLFSGGRLDVPFFCHDVSDRTLRVAADDEMKTTHPCGATGISAVEVLVPETLFTEYLTLYAKVLGSEPDKSWDGDGGRSGYFDIGVPRGDGRAKVVVREAKSDGNLARMKERGIGFSDLVIRTGEGGGKRRPLGPEGIESTIWLED